MKLYGFILLFWTLPFSSPHAIVECIPNCCRKSTYNAAMCTTIARPRSAFPSISKCHNLTPPMHWILLQASIRKANVTPIPPDIFLSLLLVVVISSRRPILPVIVQFSAPLGEKASLAILHTLQVLVDSLIRGIDLLRLNSQLLPS